MTNIREAMPLLARHEGVWDGVYSYFNDQNEKTDEHRSRLICRFPDDGPILITRPTTICGTTAAPKSASFRLSIAMGASGGTMI